MPKERVEEGTENASSSTGSTGLPDKMLGSSNVNTPNYTVPIMCKSFFNVMFCWYSK